MFDGRTCPQSEAGRARISCERAPGWPRWRRCRAGDPCLLLPEQRLRSIEQLVARGTRVEPTFADLEEITEVGGVLVHGYFRERLLALLGHARIEVAAAAARMELRSAVRAGIPPADLVTDNLELPAAVSAASHDRLPVPEYNGPRSFQGDSCSASRLVAGAPPAFARARRAAHSADAGRVQDVPPLAEGHAGPAGGEVQAGGAYRCHRSRCRLQTERSPDGDRQGRAGGRSARCMRVEPQGGARPGSAGREGPEDRDRRGRATRGGLRRLEQ